jgi:tetratricopeptide (TPR) repeat protein
MKAATRFDVTEAAAADTAPDCPRRCGDALDLFLTHRGNPSAEIERVLAEDPRCVFAHCLRAALIVRGDDIAARSRLAASLAAIEAACPDRDDPARRHAEAAHAWLAGDPALAAERYGALVVDRPRDVVALAVAHALDFRLGHRPLLRDRVALALAGWDAAAPGYASILAMLAFGLEENGEYRRAEKMARRALALDPRQPAAVHVVAHVMEMEGRARDGLAFLAATEPTWREGTGFSVHLAWHRALFHLDADGPDAALAVYDAQIAGGRMSHAMPALTDASALLWRLRLLNVDVGARWRRLADRWQRLPLDGVRPFYVMHAAMAFAAVGRRAAVLRLLDALPPDDAAGASPPPEEALARPLCAALLAFARGDYAACVEWLGQVRRIAHRCGGSLAQCDLVHLTFAEAALRAREAHRAHALVAERAALRPESRLNRLLQQRLGLMPAAA